MQCSLIAQLVEHTAVNRVVTGSSPVRGAIFIFGKLYFPKIYPVDIF